MKTGTRYKTSREIPFQEIYPLNDENKCRLCGCALTGKQTSWCSDACQNTAFAEVMFRRGHPQYVRQFVFERDAGICAWCGLDCKIIQRISDAAYQNLYDDALDEFIKMRDALQKRYAPHEAYKIGERMKSDYLKFARRLWRATPLNFGSSCWHADHILEVVNGGSNALLNLQTLCVLCHKWKTKNLVKIESFETEHIETEHSVSI